MLNENTSKILSQYNSIFKENDEIYRKVAKELGLSDCAFWILYNLSENDTPLTQSDICYCLYQPKQTVNSALKKMEHEGYIKLIQINDRRSKQIYLTEEGKRLAEETVNKVINIECETFSELTKKEQENFIKLFRKYTDLLKNNIKKLNKK